MRESKFVYRKRTPDQFRAVMNRRGGGFDSYLKRDFKKYKMKDGKNVIRFLPPTWGDAVHFAFEIFLNYDIGPDKQSYLSLSKMGKGKDPLAEARENAFRTDPDLAKALNVSRRWVAWVIDREAEEEGPQLFDFPGKLNTAICTASQDEDTNEIIYADDPREGADVRFYKEGTGKTGTNYPGEKVKVLKPGPLSEDGAQSQEWLDFVQRHPIPECLQFYDYNHISAVFNGAVKEEEVEDDGSPIVEETLKQERARKREEAKENENDGVPW